MGNTHSDGFQHNFKRLRLSETDELPQVSPSSTSPKRKLPINGNGTASKIDHVMLSNAHQQYSSLSCANNVPSSPSTRNSIDHVANQDLFADNDFLSFKRPFSVRESVDDLPILQNSMSNNTATRTSSCTEIPSELSDADVIECIKYSYIKDAINEQNSSII